MSDSTASRQTRPERWLIRRGTDQFDCPDIDTLKGWWAAGRIAPHDLVFHSSFGSWKAARDVEALRGSTASSTVSRTTRQVPAIALIPIIFLSTCAGCTLTYMSSMSSTDPRLSIATDEQINTEVRRRIDSRRRLEEDRRIAEEREQNERKARAIRATEEAIRKGRERRGLNPNTGQPAQP